MTRETHICAFITGQKVRHQILS